MAYQAGSTVYIPIYYQGVGATPDFIAGQLKAAAGLVTEDGTRFVIVPLRNSMYPPATSWTYRQDRIQIRSVAKAS